MNEALDALEALHAAATPAPWTCFPDAANADARVCYTRDSVACEWCIALAGETDDTGAWTPETLARWSADARLIAAMRNALPGLITDMRATRAALAKHGRHDVTCPQYGYEHERRPGNGGPCSCGLQQALDGAKGGA